jgi:hypothetical protein
VIRIALALVTAGVCVAAATARAPSAHAPAHHSPRHHPTNGVSWRPPPGWRGRPLAGPGDPVGSLIGATFPLRRASVDPGCPGALARRRVPPHGAAVLLLESRWAAGVKSRLRNFPRRPARLHLPAHASGYDCIGLARELVFRDADRAFYAFVVLGDRAGARRLREAERLLDSLRVFHIPPPERPVWDSWRELHTESGDTMRVPPGWTAHAMAVPREHPRPRLLFRIAGGGVELRVVEVQPGPATRAYPSLRTDPFTRRSSFVDGRAGGWWRGWRFVVTITGSSPRALDRAYAAASSIALSGGLRGR